MFSCASRPVGGGLRALFRWLEDQAVELGFGQVHLGVEVSNAAARALYAALGYTSTGHLESTRYEYPDSDGRMVPAVERNEYFVKSLPAAPREG
jgi:RimJ/RimL family protein N-acetyltransferase